MMNDKWFALEITVVEKASEAVEYALNQLDALGTEINNLGKKQSEDVVVIGYFNQRLPDERVNIHLNEALRIYGFDKNAAFEWRGVEDRDWLAEWKKHWKPTVTESFIVAPPWEEIGQTEKHVIRIDPGMAFGTGTHETTKLCLHAIEEHYESGMSFFDVGTGTGILSIAAAKIKTGAKGISACDTDEDSVRIARENAELNGVSGIEFYIGSISEETPAFDFVCANVTADVIVPLLPLLLAKTEKVLVLSGILVEQEKLLTDELRKLNVTDFQIKTDGEWIGIVKKGK